MLHLSDLHFVAATGQSRVPRGPARRRRHRGDRRLPGRTRGGRDGGGGGARRARSPGLVVRPGLERLLRARGRSTTWPTSGRSGSRAGRTRTRAPTWCRSSRPTAGTTSRTSAASVDDRRACRWSCWAWTTHISRRHDLRVAPRRAPDRFGFAVMHSPDSAPETAALGYDFMVAGHTHGGQVRLPVVGALVTNCHDAAALGERHDPRGRRRRARVARASGRASSRRSGSSVGQRPRCWSSHPGPADRGPSR